MTHSCFLDFLLRLPDLLAKPFPDYCNSELVIVCIFMFPERVPDPFLLPGFYLRIPDLLAKPFPDLVLTLNLLLPGQFCSLKRSLPHRADLWPN